MTILEVSKSLKKPQYLIVEEEGKTFCAHVWSERARICYHPQLYHHYLVIVGDCDAFLWVDKVRWMYKEDV